MSTISHSQMDQFKLKLKEIPLKYKIGTNSKANDYFEKMQQIAIELKTI